MGSKPTQSVYCHRPLASACAGGSRGTSLYTVSSSSSNTDRASRDTFAADELALPMALAFSHLGEAVSTYVDQVVVAHVLLSFRHKHTMMVEHHSRELTWPDCPAIVEALHVLHGVKAVQARSKISPRPSQDGPKTTKDRPKPSKIGRKCLKACRN